MRSGPLENSTDMRAQIRRYNLSVSVCVRECVCNFERAEQTLLSNKSFRGMRAILLTCLLLHVKGHIMSVCVCSSTCVGVKLHAIFNLLYLCMCLCVSLCLFDSNTLVLSDRLVACPYCCYRAKRQ